MTRPSATLAIDERVKRRIAAGERIVHLGFGEAGLPVPEVVRAELARAADANSYGPVAGRPEAREAAAGYLSRRRLPTEPDHVVLAPGSKALLFALVSVLPGDLVLPQPSWVSYAAQAALARKRVHRVPVPAEAGGVPDPDALDALLRATPDARTLLVTVPDNPTGTVASPALVRAVAEVAERHGVAVIADEIYRDLAYEPERYLSFAELLPERTYVTNGLSKSMALGGYRIGFARFPDAAVRDAAVGIASEVWSSLAGPMQHVAAYVLGEPTEVTDHVRAGRELHRETTTAVHAALVGAGVECRPPSGAFYLYPDFEPLRQSLGDVDGDGLAELLLERHGIAVLPGSAFGDDPAALRFRLATSLLHHGPVGVDEAIDALAGAVEALR